MLRDRRGTERIYRRQLPGGGFVAIEVTPMRSLLGQRKYHGEIIVERRIEQARRKGHSAPVVATADSATIGAVFHELFTVAHSNVAVAGRCLAQQTNILR